MYCRQAKPPEENGLELSN